MIWNIYQKYKSKEPFDIHLYQKYKSKEPWAKHFLLRNLDTGIFTGDKHQMCSDNYWRSAYYGSLSVHYRGLVQSWYIYPGGQQTTAPRPSPPQCLYSPHTNNDFYVLHEYKSCSWHVKIMWSSHSRLIKLYCNDFYILREYKNYVHGTWKLCEVLIPCC